MPEIPFEAFVEVAFRPFRPSVPTFDFHIAWRRDNQSSVLNAFLEMLRDHAQAEAPTFNYVLNPRETAAQRTKESKANKYRQPYVSPEMGQFQDVLCRFCRHFLLPLYFIYWVLLRSMELRDNSPTACWQFDVVKSRITKQKEIPCHPRYI